jgi:hypothetical protein
MSTQPDQLVAVIGAGPYGLAVTSHLRALAVPTHAFGEPFEYWRKHMPEGMHLKSSWTASTIASPQGKLSLTAYEQARGAPLARPIPVADFVQYLGWYQHTAVPDIDPRRVTRIERAGDGFTVTVSGGEELPARRVVLATGLHGFSARPPVFDSLPPELVSHTDEQPHPELLAGRRVLVVGAGQSAIESAVLAHEAGATVQVLVRAPEVHWLTRKARLDDGWQARKLYAPSDVGPAGLSWVVSLPELMRRLPLRTRRRMIGRCLRPAATAWLLPRADGIGFTTGRHAVAAVAGPGGGVLVTLDDATVLEADHVLLGTGFRPSLARVPILAPELRDALRARDGYPVLGDGFETSVPGLHIVGALAAESFGPLMRFVAGTWYSAPALARHVAGHGRPTTSPGSLPSLPVVPADASQPPA